MEFYQVIQNRRSIRGYRPDPVPDDALARIAEAVYLAPSAHNRQPYKFMFIRNEKMRDKICGVYQQSWLRTAPVIVVALGDETQAWRRLEGDTILGTDVGIAMEHLQLATFAEGMASCWICSFPRTAMKYATGADGDWVPFAIAPLGYAADAPGQRSLKPRSELFEVID